MAPKTALKLSSGYSMPLVGYGIWKVPATSAAQSVYDAIKIGYRHIDGAHDYANSREAGEGVRKALQDGLCKREDLFITSKLWNTFHEKERALAQAKSENEKWGVGYIDLYLIHFPISQAFVEGVEYPCFWTDKDMKHVTPQIDVPIQETWQALESLTKTKENPHGILHSIGVANFSVSILFDLLRYAKIKPAVNQVEIHPYNAQPELIKLCQSLNIAVTAYSSFGPASFIELSNPRALNIGPLFENEAVKSAASAHGKTPAQVLLRWATQRDIIVIPKSNNTERLKQNLDSLDFELSDKEIEAISGLDRGLRFNDPKDFGFPVFA